VRVRLLVDDLFAAGQDQWLGALDAHARIEVRLFNPLGARGASPTLRVLQSLHRFEAINRRMHNKLLIADGQLALSGGRNIGDAYFHRGADANFIDLDVLSTGAVTQELSALFDAFWNHRLAYPASHLVAARTAWSELPVAALPADAVEAGSVASQIEGGWLALRFAPVRVIADAPAKAVPAERPDQPGEAMAQVLQLMRAAHSQVLIASPYFVPGRIGLELMREANSRGIHLAVMTNSLGATDEPIVHHGYTRYRLQMLQLGVKLAELSPRRGAEHIARGGSSAPAGRLHAKLAVIDGRWLLVGSMNMDRRSSRLNTEIALAIDDPVLAADAQALLRNWQRSHYAPRLAGARGPIEWVAHGGDAPVVHGTEPHADGLLHVPLRLLSKMLPEELL
jgi:putative cardiolipin synthase